MIKCVNGVVETPKDKVLAMTEFTLIASAIKVGLVKGGASEDDAKKEIREAVEMAFLSEEELKEVLEKQKAELTSEIGKTAAKIFGIILDQMM